jgi:Rieske Fe-S protein
MQEMNRRQFVARLGVVAAAGTCLVGGCQANDPLAWSGPVDFDLGPAAEVKEGVDAQWATSGGFFLVREGAKVYAVSAICSHKACALLPPAAQAGQLQCPCHGSRFTRQGKVLNGPATTSLVHFGISTSAAGRLLVDRRKMFDEPRWDEAGAFVTV